jgi:predicted nucleic acid-binding protein
MKCLDTPILEDLLLGRPRVKRWLDKVESTEGEVATTELNMIELAVLAKAHGGGLNRRLDALGALRRELTVLPMDAETYRAAISILRKNAGGAPYPGLLVAASALAHGATVLLTDKKRALPRDLGTLKVQRY